MRTGIRIQTVLVAASAVVLVPALAHAQTWAGGRQGPALAELFAVDATGEAGWLYGAEDLAGDGVAEFQQQEQSIDIRTAYAAADNNSMFVRVYVSDAGPAGGNVSAYIFIDSDQNSATGGNAAATSIDPRFTTDGSPGGYEFVLGVRGNQSVIGGWQWQAPAWTAVQMPPNRADAEAGAFLDPIRINGNVHGYLQGSVQLGEVGLTSACLANLFVRTTNETAALGAGDLEVGQVGRCVPSDGNQNGVPDPAEPRSECSSDAQCPNGGVCVNGRCILAAACTGDADCAPDEQCLDGRCVARPTNTPCSSNAECGALICEGGRCVPCASGQCGDSRTCGPDGRCTGTPSTGGPTLAPGEDVQGGACACNAPGSGEARWAIVLLLGLPFLLSARRLLDRRSPSARLRPRRH
jgi:hypothetical protein